MNPKNQTIEKHQQIKCPTSGHPHRFRLPPGTRLKNPGRCLTSMADQSVMSLSGFPAGQRPLEPLEKDGAAEGTRTPDPIITNDVLYQLSYSGILLGTGPTMAMLTFQALA